MTDLLGSDKQPFFDRWRVDLVASMTLIDALQEGNLYFCNSPYGCNVWVLEGPRSVVVDYYRFEDLEKIRGKVQMWAQALEAGIALNSSGGSGLPLYGAKEDLDTKELIVVWFSLGDWFGLARRHPLPKEWHQLPQGWPESYRDRIIQLAAARV